MRVRRGNVRDSETCSQAEAGEGKEEPTCDGFVASISLGHDACGHGGGDTGDEGPEFDDAVSPGQPIVWKQLRQETVFRRPEKSCFHANQKDGSAFHGQIVQIKGKDGEGHHDEFEQLGADSDTAFAITVGKVSAGHGKQNEGDCKQRADDQDQAVAKVVGEIHGHDDVNDQELNGVVVEGSLELGSDQAPEAGSPGASDLGFRFVAHEGGERNVQLC